MSEEVAKCRMVSEILGKWKNKGGDFRGRRLGSSEITSPPLKDVVKPAEASPSPVVQGADQLLHCPDNSRGSLGKSLAGVQFIIRIIKLGLFTFQISYIRFHFGFLNGRGKIMIKQRSRNGTFPGLA